ncbi:MAG: acetyltransferase [Alcanivorax sp.]|uniref:acetyltransferase n=1 Tax=Alcanivorax sp. TaxID=1872427 RepID=UPI003DA71C31
MFLKELKSGHLVQVVDPTELVNPLRSQVTGRYHHGEEAQEAEPFDKGDLVFPSGETLPKCWVDSHYRDDEIPSTGMGI